MKLKKKVSVKKQTLKKRLMLTRDLDYNTEITPSRTKNINRFPTNLKP